MGKALNRMGQMKVIRVASAYITSRLESIHIPAKLCFTEVSLMNINDIL